jgi:uncharacterized protein YjbI with pentapeptide repeats
MDLRISTAFSTSFKNADLSGAKLDNIKLKDVTETLCYMGGL